MRRLVPTHDLGRQLPRSTLALPEQYHDTPPPPGTPPGFGVDFWLGSERTTRTEYWEFEIARRDQVVMRVRTTIEGALLGVYDGVLTSKGHVKKVRADMQADAERIEQYASATSCKEVLGMMREVGMRVTFERRARKRKTARPPLLQIFWASMVCAAHLVWTFDVRAPGSFADWRTDKTTGDRFARNWISADELLRRIDGGKRLDWWLGLSDEERAAMAMQILSEAHDKAATPPPWEWWAGTMRRSAGWVCRDDFTGWLRPVGVRAWDPTKRSGIKTAVDRFVRERDVQEDLFLATRDQVAT